MSPQAVNIVNDNLSYDFTTANSFTVAASFGQKQLSTGAWAAYAGNADQSSTALERDDIKSPDKTI